MSNNGNGTVWTGTYTNVVTSGEPVVTEEVVTTMSGTDGDDVLSGETFGTVTTSGRELGINPNGKDVYRDAVIGTAEVEVAVDQTITGGAGNDTMTGGLGKDTFVFNFDVSTETKYFYNAADTANDGATLSTNANIHAWTNAYAEWKAAMAAEGFEFDNDDAASLTVNTANSKKPGQVFSIEDNTAERTVVTSTDGHDTITDFTVGQDKLQLNGIDQSLFNRLFTVTQYTGEDNSVGLMISGGGWSVALAGVSVDLDSATALKQFVWDNLIG